MAAGLCTPGFIRKGGGAGGGRGGAEDWRGVSSRGEAFAIHVTHKAHHWQG